MTTATYSHAREHFAEIWDEAENTQAPIIMHRRGHQDMAILSADALASLTETAHLLRSPKNALRLLTALTRSERLDTPPTELAELRIQLGLDATR